MVHGSSLKAEPVSKFESQKGKLQSQFDENKLMHLVLENDKQIVDEGKLVKESYNSGISRFVADDIYEALVNNYSLAKKLYGKRLLRLITRLSTEELKRNLRIPEFRKKMRKELEQLENELKREGLIDRQGEFTWLGNKLASVILFIEELNQLLARGKLAGSYAKLKKETGEKTGSRQFTSSTAYRDINIRRTIKRAILRERNSILKEDLVAFEREEKGSKWIVFVLDSSSSMKQEKLDQAKKAALALALKATEEGNRIGLVVFSSDVIVKENPTRELNKIILQITKATPRKQTDIAKALSTAVGLFPRGKLTKHMILLTDALPTSGKSPKEQTLKEVANAKANNITLSVVGIQLDREGAELAKQMAKLGNGRLYLVKETKELDKLVLLDYYSTK